MNQAPGQPPRPSGGRTAALNSHARALASGNPFLHQAAIEHLSTMNPTDKEIHYVHQRVQKLQAPKIGPTGIQGIRARQGNAQIRQLKQAEGVPGQQARAQKNAFKAARPVKTTVAADKQFLRQGGEFLTGYQQLQHPGRDPLGAGLAALGLLPFGKLGELGRTVATGVRAAQEGRTAEEAAAHIVEATKEAKAKGFGDVTRAPHEPIRVAPGSTSSSTGGELGKQVREALAGRVDTSNMGRYEAIGAKTGIQSARKAYESQQALQSAERGVRAGKGAEAMKIGGQAGYHAALGQLKGELPKIDWQNFKHLDQHTLDALFTHVQQHEGLRFYEKITAQRALSKMASGLVPATHEQKMLERVFGKDATKQLVDSIPFWKKAKALGYELLNVPRALMASFDLSAPFRQGLMAGVHSPVTFGKNFGSMLRSFKSEHVYQGVMNGVYEHPLFPLAQKAKLAITDIGLDPHTGTALSQREEQFMSNLAERIPILGHGVRASDRAYTGFLNKMRMDMFTRLTQQAAENGHDIHDQKVIESIAKFVNSATGRGDLGMFQKHAVSLNTLLFSPRLLMSRLNFMNPVYYARLDPFARVQALRAARNLLLTMGTVLYAAKMAGAKVNTDPTNADFAKIKIGNTRIDLAGGFQQPVRLAAQLFLGRITSSTTGKVIHLGPQGVGHLSRKDIAQRFIEGKLAPVPSAVNDLMQGTTFAGQPLNAQSEIGSRLTPLVWQDLYGIAANGPPWRAHIAHGSGQGPLDAALLAIPDLLGVGVQNYSAKKPKGRGSRSNSSDPYGGGSSGGGNDPYSGGGSSSSSDPYGG